MAENVLDKIPYEKIWVIPPWQRWLAVAGVILLFFVAYYFASHKGTTEQITQLTSNREELKTKHRNYVKYTKKIPEIQKDIDKLHIDLKKARVKLPSAKEIPELLTTISSTGTKAGLEFLLFRPFPEQIVDFYSTVPVEMVIEGYYHNIATFFDKVKKMSRIVDISDVKISSKANSRLLKISCKATTYKYLEGAALKTKPKKGKK